jgi:UDP-glucuronate decarboxylase
MNAVKIIYTPKGPVIEGTGELARKVIEFTGSKSQILFEPRPTDDPMQRLPDIAVAKEKLNWEPSISLEDGLKKTIEYFKNLIKGKI